MIVLADLEWKIIYVGAAESEEYDQTLETILVGPVPSGRHKFVFQVMYFTTFFSVSQCRAKFCPICAKRYNVPSNFRVSWYFLHQGGEHFVGLELESKCGLKGTKSYMDKDSLLTVPQIIIWETGVLPIYLEK